MIYITQGHESSVGLELFSRALPFFTQKELKKIIFIADPNTFNQYFSKKKKISFNYLPSPRLYKTQTLDSLLFALKSITSSDLLFTLPTSKDQLYYKQRQHLGYTEFLRHYFNKPELSMNFISPTQKISLLTDHLPLKNVASTKTTLLLSRAVTSVSYFVSHYHIKKVIFTGINPHAGENGLLGKEDNKIKYIIKKIRTLFPHVSFLGPISADTTSLQTSCKDLVVYCHHDQALSFFKEKNGLCGINLTAGLPFTRVSVDHGTAFSLLNKHQANFLGLLYTLKTCFHLQKP